MVVPTTVTMMPGPVSDAKFPPLPLRLSADRAAPLIEPLIVAPAPVPVFCEFESGPGPIGDDADDPHEPAARPVAMSATITIVFLKFTSSLRVVSTNERPDLATGVPRRARSARIVSY